MKKLIALGLSAMTAGTFAFTLAAPAAHADTVITTLCNALPSMLVTSNATTTNAMAADSTAQTTLSTKASARDLATSDYIDAVVAELNAIVGGNVNDINNAVALVGVRQGALGTAFSDWSNANVAAFAAHTTALVDQWGTSNVLGYLSSSLSC